MKNPIPLARNSALIAPMVLALFLVQCSESPSTQESGNAPDQGMPAQTGNGDASDGSVRPSTNSAGRERLAAVEDLRTIRAQMMAELEAVRGRLNVGTSPEPQQKADEERAAELAQGLERADRYLVLAEAATDGSWANAQDTTRIAARELRTWWDEHGGRASAKVY